MQQNTRVLNIADCWTAQNTGTQLHSHLFALSVFACWWQRAKDVKTCHCNYCALPKINVVLYNILAPESPLGPHVSVSPSTHASSSIAENDPVIDSRGAQRCFFCYVLLLSQGIDSSFSPKSNLTLHISLLQNPEVMSTQYWSSRVNSCPASDITHDHLWHPRSNCFGHRQWTNVCDISVYTVDVIVDLIFSTGTKSMCSVLLLPPN